MKDEYENSMYYDFKNIYNKKAYIIYAFYSLLSASTGSFFAALCEGIKPAITVKTILMPIKAKAFHQESIAVND